MARAKKGRPARSFARREPVREPYDRVLIVCEGEKTEPNYFEYLRIKLRLSSANIRILHPQGTDPITIVKAGEEGLTDQGFDQVLCVFDKDGHARFDEAVQRAERFAATSQKTLCAITSVPCFELWVLLHFEYTSAAFSAVGNRSSCDNVIARLKSHVLDYAKGSKSISQSIADRIETAMTNASRLDTYNADTGSSNPMTKVHKLIEALRDLKNDDA